MSSDLFETPARQGAGHRHGQGRGTRAVADHGDARPVGPLPAYGLQSGRRPRAGHRGVTADNNNVKYRHGGKTYQAGSTTRLQTMSAPKASLRAVLDRLLQHYFDKLADRVTLEVRQAKAELDTTLRSVAHDEARAAAQDTRESLQERVGELGQRLVQLVTETQLKSDQRHREALQDIDETRGALQRDLSQAEDELRGAFQRELASARDALDGHLSQAEDELRGAFQRELASARDDIRGTVELFRDGFEDFRAKVEPRVMAVERRMDSLELRMMTFQTLQKDFAELRSRDMASVRREAASLRDDLRRDIVELTRMLRMQGDAADQVAEALGRTIVRLSEELEALGEATADLRSLGEGVHQPV